MGRAYADELKRLQQTVSFACDADVKPLVALLAELVSRNLIFPTLLFAPIVGLALLPLDMLLLALIARLRPQDFIQLRCQVCNLAVRPLVRWPRTRQQFLWGGWTCRGCGSELDRHGNLRT